MPRALLLLLLLQLLLHPAAAFYNPFLPMRGRARQPNAAWRNLRAACRATRACAGFVEDEAEDCVLRCVSPPCWALVYEGDELEPGQFDNARARAYDACLKRSEKGLRAAGLWPPRLGPGDALDSPHGVAEGVGGTGISQEEL